MASNNPESKLSQFALGGLADAFRLSEHIEEALESSLKLRLALHFCPVDAIQWDATRSDSRVDVISRYLQEAFAVRCDEAVNIARDVATVLRCWETQRQKLASRVEELLARQSNKCATCHVEFSEERRSLTERGELDSLKPYHLNPGAGTWMAPEVDHIVPISVLGTNDDDNLQVLCKLCNAGKGDSTGISLMHEYQHCSSNTEVTGTPQFHQHIRQLHYYRLRMDLFRCTKCDSCENELAIRKVRGDGVLTLSNLTTLCFNCIKESEDEQARDNRK